MIRNFYLFSAFKSLLEEREQEEKEAKTQKTNTQESLDPYVGPRPFTRQIHDQVRFFGRADEAEEIVSLILGHKAVLVYAQSGSGKTSLFEAKVVPELKKYEFEVLPRCRVGIPSDIEHHVIEQEKYDEVGGEGLRLSSFADKSLDQFLSAYLSTYSSNESETRTVLLVFDQFEELFTTWPPNSSIHSWIQQRQDFFKQIANVIDKFDGPRVQVVFIMREEFLAELDRYVRFLPERLRPRFRLERLRRDAAVDAILKPLEKTRGESIIKERHISADDLNNEVNRIVKSLLQIRIEDPDTIAGKGKAISVEGEFVEPIHLQVVCQQRVSAIDPAKKKEREQARSERLKWYQLKWTKNPKYKQGDDTEVGLADEISEDVDRALREFYEKAVAKAKNEAGIKEDEIRKLFDTKFITTNNTRSFVSREDFKYVIYHMERRHSITGRIYEQLIKAYDRSIGQYRL